MARKFQYNKLTTKWPVNTDPEIFMKKLWRIKDPEIMVFWDVMPYSMRDIYQHLEEPAPFSLSPILKTEAECSSKTSVSIFQTIQHHVPEGYNLNTHYNENIRYQI
jgi:hypothetical protein